MRKFGACAQPYDKLVISSTNILIFTPVICSNQNTNRRISMDTTFIIALLVVATVIAFFVIKAARTGGQKSP